jgi:hypothetical protein
VLNLVGMGAEVDARHSLPARGPPTDGGELVQVHDDRDVFQASPDELPAIDIHSLWPLPDASRSPGNGRLGHGLRRREKKATAGGCAAFWRTASGRPKRPISLLKGSPSARRPLRKCN